MRSLIKILLISCLPFLGAIPFAFSQDTKSDSLKIVLKIAKNDSERLDHLAILVWNTMWSFPDSALPFVHQEVLLAKKNKSDSALAIALTQFGVISYLAGNFPEAIHFGLEGLKAAERSRKIIAIGVVCHYLTEIYADAGDYSRAFFYSYKSKSLFESGFKQLLINNTISDTVLEYYAHIVILARAFEKSNQPDSALKYVQIADQFLERSGLKKWATLLYVFGNTYSRKENYPEALNYYRIGLNNAINTKEVMENYIGIARIFQKTNLPDSGIYYAYKGLESGRSVKFATAKLDALSLLAELYKSKGNIDSNAKYLKLTLDAKDSLFSQQKIMQLQSFNFIEQQRQQDIVDYKKAYQNRIKMYILIGGVIVLFIIASILFRNNRQKQKAKIIIEAAYNDLKSTQAQLIQSEKMASLGELTAGIAHEIQNPLNFVNNFSEVNKELLVDMKSEIDKGNLDEVKSIANDVIDNSEKINHHGKRADAIVKGMLQHSRTNSGQKELTDINKLTDEYLRLAYHGLRAKDKNFNADIKTEFDDSIGKINIVPQDIGRVILNLINNAFYSVSEKQKQNVPGYEPTVILTTKQKGDRIEIKVSDNGNGVPQKVLDKIFQPFFTTKPTGQGTGLGLSLAYDIIKAHGGEIKVQTREGEGSEFIIKLPIV